MHAMPCSAGANSASDDGKGGTRLANAMQAALKSSLERLFTACALKTPRLCYSAVLLGLQRPCRFLALPSTLNGTEKLIVSFKFLTFQYLQLASEQLIGIHDDVQAGSATCR